MKGRSPHQGRHCGLRGVFSQRNQTMDEKGGQAGQSTGGRATEGRWQQGEEGAVGLMRAVLLFLLFSC